MKKFFTLCRIILSVLVVSGSFAQAPTFIVTNAPANVAGQGSKFQQLIRVQLRTFSRDQLSSITFRLTGSGNIKAARLYIGSTFYPWSSLYGNEISPVTKDTITFTASGKEIFDLTNDTYFWLVADIKETATAGQQIDAECLGVVINNSYTLVPSNGNPAGARTIVAPMNGVYTIKGTAGPKNFKTLSEAIDTFNCKGSTGGVTFLLQDDSVFAENLSSRAIYQSGSPANPVIFKRSGNGTNKPIVRPSATSSGDDAAFTLWCSDYVTIDGIIIDGPSVSSQRVEYGIRLRNAATDGCQNITIKNCTIQLDSTQDCRAIYANRNVVLTSSEGNNNKLRIINNIIRQARWGIYLDYGNFSPFQEDSVIIDGNTISSIAIQGGNSAIYARDINNLEIRNNEIKDIRLGLSYNDWIRGMDVAAKNLKIYSNKVHGITNPGNTTGSRVIGILAYGQNNYIYNNMVWDLNVSVNTAVTAGNEVIRGISVQGYNNIGYCYVYHNTVYIASPTNPSINQYSSALHVENNITTCEIINNILVNLSTGAGGMKNIALFYNADPSRTYSSLSDNNLFYAGSPGVTNLICRMNGTDYQTLKSYQMNGLGRDINSVSEMPPFLSTEDLHIKTGIATFIEKGGKAVAMVTKDIDGNTRDGATPDMGADEGDFLAASDTSGPLIIHTPLQNMPLGSGPTLQAVITDRSGVNTTTAKPRVWYRKLSNASAFGGANDNSFNGWKWVEASNNSSPFIFTLDYNLLNGGPPATDGSNNAIIEYFIAAQDNCPYPHLSVSPSTGSYTATTVANFTAISGTRYRYKTLNPVPFNGDYLIGVGDGEPYATLMDAANALNNGCISGPVRLLLNDASYSHGNNIVSFSQITGSSPTNTITIKPAPGVSPVITFTPTADNRSAIELYGADNFIIDGSNTAGGTSRDLTIQYTSTSRPGAIINIRSLGINQGARNNVVKNCILSGPTGIAADVYGIASGGTGSPVSQGDDNDSLTIQNNLIKNVRYGIYVKGNEIDIFNKITVTGNTLDSLFRNGMEFQRINNLTVDNNIIRNVNSGTANATYAGMWIQTNVKNAVISNNQLYNIKNTTNNNQSIRGIDVNTGNTDANISLINNMIGNIAGPSTYGIFISNTGNFSVLHNTVCLNENLSTLQPSFNTEHACIRLNSSTYNGQMLNNIFNNHILTAQPTANTYKTYALYFEHNNPLQNILCDYNVLWVGNKNITTKGFMGRMMGSDRTNINDIRMMFGIDWNSLVDSVKFVAVNDLHIDPAKPSAVESNGTAAGVTKDIDNETRHASKPDIGADEGTFIYFNNKPTDIILSKPRVNEASPANSFLLKLSTADLDIPQGDKHTYALVNGTGNTDNGLLIIKNDSLFVGASNLPAYTAKDTLKIRVRTTDLTANRFEKAILIPVNAKPVNIVLPYPYINSGKAKGTLVTDIVAVDPTDSSDFTYELVAGPGDTNNASFHIVNNQLFVDSVFTYPATKKVYVRIKVTDKDGLSFEKALTININDAPVNITLNTNTINENAVIGTIVGTLTGTDPNGDVLTYTLPAGQQDNAQFSISNGNKLASAAVFDYESKRAYSIIVRGTDPGGLFIERPFVITVKDVFEPPTKLVLSDTTVLENMPEGTSVGFFTHNDPDSGDVITYSLFVGPGSTDNSRFRIIDDTLYTNEVFDYEAKKSFSIRVRATDKGGKYYDQVFIIAIKNDPSDDPIIASEDNRLMADIYPVPTSSILNVKIHHTDNVVMTISDLTGKEIMNQRVQNNMLTIDMGSYARGMYLLKITDNTSSITVKIIVE